MRNPRETVHRKPRLFQLERNSWCPLRARLSKANRSDCSNCSGHFSGEESFEGTEDEDVDVSEERRRAQGEAENQQVFIAFLTAKASALFAQHCPRRCERGCKRM